MDLCNKIKKSRSLKETSCKTYMSALKKIKNKVDKTNIGSYEEIKDTNFLKDYDKVMEVIDKEKEITSKKNKLTAILVALKSDKPEQHKQLIDKYGNKLKSLNDIYMEFLKKQEKTEKQKNNWIEYNDFIKIINNITDKVKKEKINKKKDDLNKNEFNLLQQLVILRTYLDFPLRNDFADMRVLAEKDFKKIDKEERDKKNFLVLYPKNKKEFHINQFKNKKFLGPKILNISPKLGKVINLWLKHNKSGWFLVKSGSKTPMNPNNITKFLNSIFLKHCKKKISTGMLRHIIISHDQRNEKTIKQQEENKKKIQNKYFHSKEVNDLYRKIN